MDACPGDDTITLFTCGQLDGAGKAEIEQHVAGCEHCKKLVGILRHTVPHVAGSTTTASTLFAKTFGLLPPGTAIGRYQIEGLVGAGGMGVVYAAHDPELDRKVALKLLYRRKLGTSPGDADLEERLRGESKAMARLKHPNVATIHDIGRYGDQLFLVLEYIAGGTLRAWVEQRRPWETVLETFRAAGRGLAAAHAAGIVHCDFKPDNVLIASDGHPVVTDFGLAQLIAEARARDSAQDVATSTASPPVVGTPAYMAPERFDATSRAHVQGDVFGFCVALYEVLYGERPFHGTTVAELRTQVATAEVPRPSQAVPEWLHRVLVRGLAADVAVRHQTIDELLAELTPRPRRRVALWAAAAAGVVALGTGAWAMTRSADSCDPRRELVGIWDDIMRARVTGALAASPAQQRTLRAIDQYADAWSARACTASTDVQQRCLRSAKLELGTITHAIAEGGPAVAKRGDLYVGDLPAIEDCSGRAPTKPVPTDPALRADVDKLRDELAGAAALDIAARFDAAKAKLDALEPRAQQLGYRPLVAEIKYERAMNIEGTETSEQVQAQAFRDAAASATAAGHEVLAVRAWLSLATEAAQRSGDFARGREYASYARAALDRIGGDRRLEARLAIVRGNIDWRDGKLDAARKEFAHASELTGDDPHSHIDALDGLARVDTEARKLSDALAEQLEVLAIRRKLYSDDHPEIARSFTALGNVTMLLGRSAESLDYYRKADATAQRAFGPEHPMIAFTAHNLGGILRDLHRPVDAEAAYRRALAVGRKAFGPEHPNVAKTQQSLGMALFDQGKFADAVAELEHAVAIKRKAYGDDHVETLGALNDLGIALRGAGQLDRAIELAATAVAGLVKVYGPDHPEVGQALVAQARTFAAAQRTKDAAASLDRAEAIFKHGESNPEALADIADARKRLYSRGRTQ